MLRKRQCTQQTSIYQSTGATLLPANFLVKIGIPDWMNENEQEAMLEALDKCNFKKRLQGSAIKVLERTKRLSLSEVKVED